MTLWPVCKHFHDALLIEKGFLKRILSFGSDRNSIPTYHQDIRSIYAMTNFVISQGKKQFGKLLKVLISQTAVFAKIKQNKQKHKKQLPTNMKWSPNYCWVQNKIKITYITYQVWDRRKCALLVNYRSYSILKYDCERLTELSYFILSAFKQ